MIFSDLEEAMAPTLESLEPFGLVAIILKNLEAEIRKRIARTLQSIQ